MSLTSVVFLLDFLPIVLIFYFALTKINSGLKNIVLLFASLLFYAWGNPKAILILVFSCLINYFIGLLLDRYKDHKMKIVFFICGIAFQVGLLFIFKYLHFAMMNVNNILSTHITIFNNVPLGLSFFTLQGISYLVDVYRKRVNVQTNIWTLSLYLAFFPTMFAGPIIRYENIQQQLEERKESFELFSKGICRFVRGLAKYVILAQAFGIIADQVFNMTQIGHRDFLVPMTLAWVGLFSFTLQIYLQLSSLSDMAIGLGAMFGFHIEENFYSPYSAKSLQSFFRRWNMSFMKWMNEYVFVPLEQKNHNKDRFVLNLFLIWVLIGVWYGVGWNFILWGIWNFVFILIEQFIDIEELHIKAIYKHIYVLVVVQLGWVVFRCHDFNHILEFMKNLFGFNNNGFFSLTAWMFIRENIVFLIIGVLLCLPYQHMIKRLIEKYSFEKKWIQFMEYVYPIMMLLLFLICLMYIMNIDILPCII